MTNKMFISQIIKALEDTRDSNIKSPSEQEQLIREIAAAKGAQAMMNASEKLEAVNNLYTDFDKMIIRDIPPHYIREIEALLLESASYFGEYASLLEKKDN